MCLRSATQFQEKGGMNNTGNYKDDYAKNSIESPARKGQSISSSPSPLIYANEMYTLKKKKDNQMRFLQEKLYKRHLPRVAAG